MPERHIANLSRRLAYFDPFLGRIPGRNRLQRAEKTLQLSGTQKKYLVVVRGIL